MKKVKHEHAGHGFTHTHVDLHDDGSATIHHTHADGPMHDIHHAVADLDGVHDSMQEHLNPEYKDEESAEEHIHPGIHEAVQKLMDKE